jgi:hypothetical protein
LLSHPSRAWMGHPVAPTPEQPLDLLQALIFVLRGGRTNAD